MASPILSNDIVPSGSSCSSGSGTSSGSSSAASSDVESEAHASLRCVLCRELYTQPRVLGSCFHTFCLSCLQCIQELPDRIVCPVCQTETYLSSAGLAGLLPDYAVMNLVEEQTFDMMALTCGGCKGRNSALGGCEGETNGGGVMVVAHCFDCGSFLCANCELAHRFMHCFEGHQVAPVNDLYSGHQFKMCKTVKCSRHRSENLIYYCRTCSTPICRDCTVLEHPKGHDYCHIAQVANEEIEAFVGMAKRATQKAIELRSATKNVEQSSLYLQQQYTRAKGSINDTFNFFVAALEERKLSLLKELDAAFNDKQVSLSTAAQEMQSFMTKVTRACMFINRLVHHASNVETLVCKSMVEGKLRSVIDYIPEAEVDSPNAYDLEFSSSKQNIQAVVRNAFGVIRQARNGPTVYRRTSVPSLNPIQSQMLENLTTANTIMQANALLSNSILNNGSIPQSIGHFDASLLNGLTSSAALNGVSHWNDCGSTGGNAGDIFATADMFTLGDSGKSRSNGGENTPPKTSIPRTKMVYNQKFGEFGSGDGQFTEPSGVAVNINGDILVADTNNHRIQIFDRNGDFRFQFGQCGKRDGQLLYPNRVAVCKLTGNIIVTERSPTHQVQIFTQDGVFIRKFGSNKLQHPRGVTVDNKGRIIIVECKVMRVIIFDQNGNELGKFGCSKHLEFPNGVVVNDKEEIFISDNRSHCVKVFSYSGIHIRDIGGEGFTNYPIGVGINAAGEILIADNHNNFNVTVFKQDGEMVAALESRVKHAQCFDVALGEDGTIVLASRDFRVYIYHYSGSRSSPQLSASSVCSTPNFLLQQPNDFIPWFDAKLAI